MYNKLFKKSEILFTFSCFILTDSAISLEPFKTVAIPKSPSFTNPDLVRKMLSVLMSLKVKKNYNIFV